jgi:hypothetical protein
MVRAPVPVASLMRLAARPVGENPHPFGCRDAQDRVDDRGLADTGATGDDQDLGGQRQPNRGRLAFRQG